MNTNEQQKERAFDCSVEVTLRRVVKVETSNYEANVSEDDNGEKYTEYDTSTVDWEEEYNNQHITLLDMLKELRSYVQCDLAMTGANTGQGRYLQRLLEACKEWTEVSTEVEEL